MDAGRLSGALVAAACIALGAPAAADAAAGEPDPTFGTAGFTLIDEPTATQEFFNDVLLLADGRVFAGGGVGSDGAVLGRFSAAGVPDATYDGDGLLIQPDGGVGSIRSVNELEFDASGRIVGAGLGNGSAFDAVGLTRYGPDGTPDSSFGGDGVVINECGAVTCEALDLAVTADGGIATAGKLGFTASGVVKVDSSGAPDNGFDGEGLKPISVPGNPGAAMEAIEALPDGSVLVGGTGDEGAILTKVDDSGAIVGGFGTTGFAIHDLGAGPSPSGEIFDIEVAPDGGIVVVGSALVAAGVDRIVVARFTSGGTLDTSFAGDGVFDGPVAATGDAFATGLEIDAQGRIVAAGFDGVAGWAARLLPAGTPDPAFSDDGQVTIAPVAGVSFVAGIALQPDGATLLSGAAAQGPGFNLLVGRLTGDPAPPASGSCKGAQATIVASASGGRVEGTGGDDVIAGGSGRDMIAGRGGNDLICGVRGNDKLGGGGGKDKLIGGAGKDKLNGGGGKDKLNGGGAKDQLNGGGGKDRCNGGPGRDSERAC